MLHQLELLSDNVLENSQDLMVLPAYLESHQPSKFGLNTVTTVVGDIRAFSRKGDDATENIT